MNVFQPVRLFHESSPNAPVTDSLKTTRRQKIVKSTTLIQNVDQDCICQRRFDRVKIHFGLRSGELFLDPYLTHPIEQAKDKMSEQILKISDAFWNIRGDFKIGGFLNIGTHASLVRRRNGKFVLLDAYTLQGDVKERIDALCKNGDEIEAIINLHPFHTVHVQNAHKQHPNAKLYGTRRHIEKFSDLPWQPELTESDECAALFADDLEFSVPAGVDFISSNEKLHFSSVLAYHKASKTIHSDDTLMYLQLPGLLGKIKRPEISFHMTLPKTLEKRAGAVKEFRAWVTRLAEQWGDAENLCAAHSATLLGRENQSVSIANRILTALQKVEKTLQAHERNFG